MTCQCLDKNWARLIRAVVGNRSICRLCGRDISQEEIDYRTAEKARHTFDSRGVKSSGNGKTP